MLKNVLLCVSIVHFYCFDVAALGECTDLRGRLISHGYMYAPGPDTCELCICDNGHPKVCKTLLCAQPQDCQSFRVGNTCCEYICLDDVVKPTDGAASNFRVAAGSGAAVVIIAVVFIIYRLRRKKQHRPQNTDDQRSLTSIGGSMGYMSGTCDTALAAWKPLGNYLPHGEAPPPYEEAVAQCRSELFRMNNETSFHRTYPPIEGLVRTDDAMHCPGHGHGNGPRSVQQVANTQNCYNAPLLEPVVSENSESNVLHHPLGSIVGRFPSVIRLTGSLSAISSRGLVAAARPDLPTREHEHRLQHLPSYYTPNNIRSSFHRTIPRISTAIDSAFLDTSIIGFNRTDRSLHNEIRRSFHKPNENHRHSPDTGRSMPRNLNLVSGNTSQSGEHVTIVSDCRVPEERSAGESFSLRLNGGRSGTQSEEQNLSHLEVKPHGKPATKPTGQADCASPPQTLPLTVDKPSCECSYDGTNAPEGEETDDYRNECENCKSASSSRWVLEEGWVEEGSEGTQTLQRRAPPAVPPLPATATLPQPVTKQSRIALGPPSNWENWFNTIPDSDTESEEECE